MADPAIQLALFQDATHHQRLITDVEPALCRISRYNTRKTRGQEAIRTLAERIQRNGFELTRALWVYCADDGYEVFAGGNRLEAARLAGVRVHVIVHEGYTWPEISRLADQDNENDEYHQPVTLPDVWAEYARLRDEEGWTQQQIADAKTGGTKSLVSERLKWNDLPNAIKQSCSSTEITEAHLRLVLGEVLALEPLSNWLNWQQWRIDVLTTAADKGQSSRQVAAVWDSYKKAVGRANELLDLIPAGDGDEYQFDETSGLHRTTVNWQAEFAALLAESDARSTAVVDKAFAALAKRQEVSARRKRDYDAALSQKAQAMQEMARRLEELNARFTVYLGDFVDICATHIADASVDVILTDPPYSESFLLLYEQLAIVATRVLKPGGSLLVMCGQSYLPQIMQLMTPHIAYHWTLAYLTPGGQSPQLWQRNVNTFWKPVLWFVSGSYNGRWHGDVIKSAPNDNDKRYHEWGQSESGMGHLIELFTDPDQCILDPFVGGGTVGTLALRLGRQFIGIDNDAEAIRTTEQRMAECVQELLQP